MTNREKLALLIAPISSSFLFLIYSIISGATGGLWLFLFTAVISYSITLIIGLPIHFLLRKYKRINLISYSIAGILITMIPIAYFIIYPNYGNESPFLMPHLMQSVLFIVVGQVIIVSFWLIARPDKMTG
jgi:hypothetical protein